ncbi:AhpD family alkylhydroperoxidase [Actinokineospora baliensis]|uniref:carboxymuconolactone decarboxylase family protein n=1 Tax=Actinokineospora baliensis TaxID=547056 RepID=UPI00195CF5A7|nr:carboxymuconolactone decarboxylase family protein [Actinokineospora baliensis]MBM7774517.1 AhpD family alkylhydroperoxidase [Actinokineospora baliensis]
MSGGLVRKALRRSLNQVRYVTPVPPARARGVVAEVYAGLERDFGMLAPPIALHSPAPEAMAAGWAMLRETLVAPGRVDRAVKEAVAMAVSQANTCPYCVDVHVSSLGAHSSLNPTAEEHAALRTAVDWARSTGRADPPPQGWAPEMVGTAVTFHYLNRMVNLFLPESPVPTGLPPSARTTALRLLGLFTLSGGRAGPAPADLLPAADLPSDLAWARGNTAVATAFARAAAAIDAAGQRSVPASARELVCARLSDWRGEPPGLSRAWAHDAVASLPEEDRAAGRLALLTALASYQVADADIEQLRATGADDRALVELAAWASLSAARRAGQRLVEGSHPTEVPL